MGIFFTWHSSEHNVALECQVELEMRLQLARGIRFSPGDIRAMHSERIVVTAFPDVGVDSGIISAILSRM
jgi:hypothetical protein